MGHRCVHIFLRASLKIAFYGNFVVTKFFREHVQVVRFPAQKFGCLKISRKNLIFRGALKIFLKIFLKGGLRFLAKATQEVKESLKGNLRAPLNIDATVIIFVTLIESSAL